MLRRAMCRGSWVVIVAVGVLGVSALPALADSAPPASVNSNFENTYGASLSRDCGFSTPLPANPTTSLWLFCDTAIYGLNQQLKYHLTGFIPGSTAAEGPYTAGEVPQGLSELPTPPAALPTMPNSDGPAQFLKTPSGLVTSTGQPCDSAHSAYAASWISRGARRPATANPADVLIPQGNYWGEGGLSFAPGGFGIAEYDPATNTVVSQTTLVTGAAVPPQRMLGSPVFSGSRLYLFGSQCASQDQFG